MTKVNACFQELLHCNVSHFFLPFFGFSSASIFPVSDFQNKTLRSKAPGNESRGVRFSKTSITNKLKLPKQQLFTELPSEQLLLYN
jgi:hypothetical protein